MKELWIKYHSNLTGREVRIMYASLAQAEEGMRRLGLRPDQWEILRSDSTSSDATEGEER